MATNHYLVGIGAAPLVVVMSRKKFDSLPEAAKAIIRKYSGERAAATWIDSFGLVEKRMLDKLKSDPEHKTVEPSPSDLIAARRIYQSIIDTWVAKSGRNRQLWTTVETELATIRSEK